jgi:iduronate 2-sulfatase
MSRITRRKFLGQVAGTTAALSMPNLLSAKDSPSSRHKYNVLFIVSDDLRVELGCYGSLFGARTPNLDALAKAGVRFDRGYCQYPLCNPSRASLLTGRHPTRTGVLGNRTDFRKLHPDWTTLPQWFKANGYISYRSGKIFHGGIDDAPSWSEVGDEGAGTDEPRSGSPAGKTKSTTSTNTPPRPTNAPAALPQDVSRAAYSDRMVILDGNGEDHGDYRTADRAIEHLRQYKNRPFFIGCGFVKPHSPPTAPQRFYDLYDPKKIKLTPDFAAWPTVPPGFPSAAIRKRNADLFVGRGASEDEAREVIRAYLASVSWMDWNVGRVMAELDRLGLRDNTIVVFFGDNGYQLGEKGKWSKAGSLFEMGTRVPLIISAPGVKGNGRDCNRIVQLLDIYPTLTELCSLPTPRGLDGHSLVPLLNNPQAAWDQPAYSVWSEDGSTLHGVMVRTEKWRYAEYGPDGKNGAMLLDPHGDPFEMKNLAEDPRQAKICAELSALTRQYAATLGKT